MTELVPISLREARRFIEEHHRHNKPPRGWLFGVQLVDAGESVGVAIAGRPGARELQDGRTVEITRLCLSTAPRNAASQGYGALCRAAKSLGYLRAVTYTLASETGISLLAAGFHPVAELAAREAWSPAEGVNRQQENLFGEEQRPPEAKRRWERTL